MIPLKYNVRNLRVRWVSTTMTIVGIALIVGIIMFPFALTDGLAHSLRVSGDKLDLIVMRKGSTEETSSTIEPQVAREIANLEGIARDDSGQPISAAEYVTILTKPRRSNLGTTNLIVRGVQPASPRLRPDFRIVRGRDLQPGRNEAITSVTMAERFENLRLGEKLEINKVDFEVVGYFEAAGSAAESEVWTDQRDLTGARRMPGVVSVVNLRARDEVAKEELIKRVRDDEQFKLQAVDEPTHFESQMSSTYFLWYFGLVMAIFLTVGAMFAAANTMFAAVAGRTREIGTLRAIGFSRSSVIFSVLLESLLLCSLGSMLGCIAILPLNGLSTGTLNWQTFSEVTFAFQFGPWILLRGVVLAVIMGLAGGFFPALRAALLPIVEALREN